MTNLNTTGKLTTHVLDTARGCPVAGLKIELFDLDADKTTPLVTAITNNDGRCDAPMRNASNLRKGRYELRFHVSDYFTAQNVILENGQFLDVVPIQFVVADETAHYHVPLLVSPYGFSTYRGS
ncbi:hydroxyisourate hydrolase [Maritalea porphyrae]|uniref:hydroxyisourate hydrolase n=1 Tax=Maritalea porphyrae TaxID=880732 RepID=UPI0022AFF4E2|nr:hydroxyisourate hydrolase [Maritalea porphyrae]MCZ4272111.1 hydroxyisourate hydrolase [Maritalea porphyrae]